MGCGVSLSPFLFFLSLSLSLFLSLSLPFSLCFSLSFSLYLSLSRLRDWGFDAHVHHRVLRTQQQRLLEASGFKLQVLTFEFWVLGLGLRGQVVVFLIGLGLGGWGWGVGFRL